MYFIICFLHVEYFVDILAVNEQICHFLFFFQFLKICLFFQRKMTTANREPTYSSTPILFSLNLEMTY